MQIGSSIPCQAKVAAASTCVRWLAGSQVSLLAQILRPTAAFLWTTRKPLPGPVDWSQVRKGLALVGLQYGPQFSGA